VDKKTKVGEANGEGSACGVLVGMNVGVSSGVGVAGVAMAVCVPKTDATNVPTPCVMMAFTSGVGEAGGCPAQEPIRIAVNSMEIIFLRALFIFTSV
jgi:hypothetical protein